MLDEASKFLELEVVPQQVAERMHSPDMSRRIELMNFKQKIHPRACVNRERHIEKLLSQSEATLHVGCTDAPFTEQLLNTGDLLHHRLLQIAPDKVTGFDISLKNLALPRPRELPDQARSQFSIFRQRTVIAITIQFRIDPLFELPPLEI